MSKYVTDKPVYTYRLTVLRLDDGGEGKPVEIVNAYGRVDTVDAVILNAGNALALIPVDGTDNE